MGSTGGRLSGQLRPICDALFAANVPGMDVINIKRAKEWFEVMHTHKRAQTAMMTLAAGEATGAKAEAHPKSDQILLVLEGRISGSRGTGAASLEERRRHHHSRAG